jgi:DNA-binding GntR family transcriptional regulator
MLADHQTTGGYPKIATVITPDLRVIAQRRPGDSVRFATVSIEEAHDRARAYRELLAGLAARAVPVRGGLPDVEQLLGLNLAGAATDALATEP